MMNNQQKNIHFCKRRQRRRVSCDFFFIHTSFAFQLGTKGISEVPFICSNTVFLCAYLRVEESSTSIVEQRKKRWKQLLYSQFWVFITCFINTPFEEDDDSFFYVYFAFLWENIKWNIGREVIDLPSVTRKTDLYCSKL